MLENIRKNWNERIHRNAFKSELEYITKDGVKLIREKGMTEEYLPKETKITEDVYFKRSLMPLGDWARIYPPIKENDKVNYINLIFGGRRNLIKLIIVLGIVAAVFFQFYENFTTIEALEAANELCNLGQI